MVNASSNRGGVVGEIFFGLLTVVAALATYAVIRIAMARSGTDPGLAAVAALPALAALGFAAACLVLVAGRRAAQRVAELRDRYPDQPWLWEPDRWKDGRLRDRSGVGLATAFTIFALFWNGMVGTAVVMIYRQGKLFSTPPLTVFLAIFGAVGIGLIAAAIYFVAAARKFGESVFQMDAVPGVLGGPLVGTIHVPPQVPDGVEATVTLHCSSSSRMRSRSTTSYLVWQDEMRTRVVGSCLPVRFTLPFDVPPTDVLTAENLTTVHWHLSVTASVPGVDYSTMYEVPIFATAASDRSIAAGSVTAPVAASSVDDRPPNSKSSIAVSDDGTAVITFPKASGLGCGVIAFVLLPLVAWPVAWIAGAEPLAAFGVSFIALLVGAAILVLFSAGVLLMVTRVDIDGQAMRLSYGKPPLTRSRTIPLADIAEIKFASSGQNTTPRVEVHTKDGQSYQLSSQLASVEEAKWLAGEVTRLMGRAKARA